MPVFPFALAGGLLMLAGAAFGAPPQPVEAALDSSARIVDQSVINKVPLRFEAVSEHQWVARGLGLAVAIRDRGAVFPVGGRAVQLTFAGSAAHATFVGARRSATPTNYWGSHGTFRSADAYLELRRVGLYSGVDVRYYGSGATLEYDFELAPGADPSQIRMRFDGADSVRLSDHGSLLVSAGGEEIEQQAPVVYQRRATGEIASVASSYFPEEGGAYSIRLGAYDAAQPLVIDPQLLFTAYLAGSGSEAPLGIGRDANNSIYIAGYTLSDDFPQVGDPYSVFVLTPNRQVFTTKLNPLSTGDDVITYSGFFGGDFGDILRAMAVDDQGVFYLTGVTDDFFFPVTSGAYLSSNGNVRRSFISLLDTKVPGKDGLVYSTFFAGTGNDEPTAIATHDGKAYVTGFTDSLDFPVKDALQSTYIGSIDGWVAEIDPTQSGDASLVHSTYLGGYTEDYPKSIDVDNNGKVYVAGYTYSADFPTTVGSHKPFYSGGSDAFLSKLDLDAKTIEYSTFVGGEGIDQVWKVLVDDRNGLVALGGFTLSNGFPVTANAMQARPAGNGDAFLTILDLTAEDYTNSLIYSTYYGGSDGEVTYDMRLGPTGAYYLTGYTLSRDLPVRDAIRPESSGGSTDGFVAVIDPNAAPADALRYSSYVTGGGYQISSNIEVDPDGNVYVTGEVFGNVFLEGQAAPPEDSSSNVFVFVFRPAFADAQPGASGILGPAAPSGARTARSRRR